MPTLHDDNDFLDTNLKDLEALYPIAKDVLQQCNLFVNDSKTEYTRVLQKKEKVLTESPSKVMNPGEAASYLDPSSVLTKILITDVTRAGRLSPNLRRSG